MSMLSESKRLRLLSSIESLFMDPDGFGIDTATALQRSILRAIEGRPVAIEVLPSFGGIQPQQPIKEICIMSGTRGGKTFIACAAAIYASQTVRLDRGAGKNIRPGEVPRISIVSVTAELANAAYGYIRGAIEASEPLKGLLTRQPTADSLFVRHPSGHEIEIRVVPASRAGASLVGRWSAGVIFDEAPRIATEQDGTIVNLEEMVRAVRSRMLDGAMVMYIGSPVGPTGFVYDLVQKNWENEAQKACIVRAPGPLMNPFNWTPERVAELLALDPEAYKTDVLAEFRDPETSLLSAQSVDGATRSADQAILDYDPARIYTAVMDPGTRGNSWSFGIADTTENMIFRVAMTHEWTGSPSNPLSPKAVLAEMKPILEKYHVEVLLTDQYMADALRDIALDMGILIAPITITPALKLGMYESMRTRFDAGMLEIPPDARLRADLLGLKKRAGGAGIKIHLSVTPDGRHCDLAAMLALLCGRYLATPAVVPAKAVKRDYDDWIDEVGEQFKPLTLGEDRDDGQDAAHSW